MKNWIYLRKTNTDFDDIKAVALASVLWASTESYNVVHTNSVTIYLKGLDNVNIGNPSKKDGDIVSYISLPDNVPFHILCKLVAKSLDLCEDREYKPYLGFARKENEIDRQLASKKNLVLFCYFMNERERFLIDSLEKVVKEQDSETFTAVCCGSKREELISGAYDFRELIQIDEIIKNRDRISAIVTSTSLVKEIGCALDIPVIYLYSYAFVVYKNGKETVGSIRNEDITQLRDALLNLCTNKELAIQENPDSDIIRKFEVPYNFDEEIIPYYAKNASYINFIFLPPFREDSLNTRSGLETMYKGRAYMPQTREEYEWHLRTIKEHGLNFVVLWQNREEIISAEMLDYYTRKGAIGFIIANDENAKVIKDYNPKLLVISSIVQRLCKDISKKDFSYYDHCVLYYPFTRSIDAIKKLSDIKEKLVIMPNSFCHTDCPGIHHWSVKNVQEFDIAKSCPAYNDDTKSTFIYPEHLKIFDEHVGGYKLQGREWRTDYIVTICESFFNRKTLYRMVDVGLNEVLQKIQEKQSLEEYYNLKTSDIIDII